MKTVVKMLLLCILIQSRDGHKQMQQNACTNADKERKKQQGMEQANYCGLHSFPLSWHITD